ncbi:Imidazole glycerol phosphate synthase hisHF, chloroplastic [Vitis vinifera]|uniref:Imidazole glycerol phosphate synthase hisHF, chloroplastic n=1 Tax=Vitis vinifera TaxID=29760 RepID=A0A438ISG9_VITVI|nr:Imidazole glycerol phosphate synthase hisHF, chloroplastic [Vitis vinifera]
MEWLLLEGKVLAYLDLRCRAVYIEKVLVSKIFHNKGWSCTSDIQKPGEGRASKLAKRVIACLDVRTNDKGDLVVTKGDQYDVRENTGENEVRKRLFLTPALQNLYGTWQAGGACWTYYIDGADEVSFLNITGFRDFPLGDLPMLEVLRYTSENVFVPLTVGGGIRDFTDANGRYTLGSGADKISIGSDAVYAAEEYIRTGVKTGKTSLEQISRVYGNQAVVVSIDPRRVYINAPDDVEFKAVRVTNPGPNGEEYACTSALLMVGEKVDQLELMSLQKQLKSWELEKYYSTALIVMVIMTPSSLKNICFISVVFAFLLPFRSREGFDIDLIKLISDAVSIPVIASSGAGVVEHFSEVFKKTNASAALAAGIFHRKEVHS